MASSERSEDVLVTLSIEEVFGLIERDEFHGLRLVAAGWLTAGADADVVARHGRVPGKVAHQTHNLPQQAGFLIKLLVGVLLVGETLDTTLRKRVLVTPEMISGLVDPDLPALVEQHDPR